MTQEFGVSHAIAAAATVALCAGYAVFILGMSPVPVGLFCALILVRIKEMVPQHGQ